MPSCYFVIIIFLTSPFLLGCWSQECQNIGPQCDASCNIVFCSELDSKPITIVNCQQTTGKYCKANTSNATAVTYECSADRCFNPLAERPACLQTGQLPSTGNCRKSYFCNASGTAPAFSCECGQDEIFDIASQTCKVAPSCQRAPIECIKLGEMGYWNDGYCYICDMDLNPQLYRCPYHITTLGEVMKRPKGQTCKPYQPSGDNPPPVTTQPAPTEPLGPCLVPKQLLPECSNCRQFYECDNNLIPILRLCPIGYRFDMWKYKCVSGGWDCLPKNP